MKLVEIKKQVEYAVRKIKRFFIRTAICCIGLVCKIEKKIVFNSFSGLQYSDNPRAISETMHDLYPEYEQVWIAADETVKSSFPSYVRAVTPRTCQYYKDMATTFCYVTNRENRDNIYRRKKQFFIQTWHGDRGFKKVLYSDAPNSRAAITDNVVTNLCIAGSEYGVKRYREAFRYYGDILCVGTPRNDILVNFSGEKVLELKRQIGISENVKVVLYAPTFRRKEKKQKIAIDIERMLSQLEQYGEKWVCLIRAHVGVAFDLSQIDVSRAIDMTDYPDIMDLMLISDLLITDYSSCAGDFILRKKPVILAIYDIQDYRAKQRDFNADPEKVGYFVVHDDDELAALLESMTEEKIEQEYARVNNYYGTNETGEASKVVCELIHQKYRESLE